MDQIDIEFPDKKRQKARKFSSFSDNFPSPRLGGLSSSSVGSPHSRPFHRTFSTNSSLPDEAYYSTPWRKLSPKQKRKTVFKRVFQFLALLGLLYMFLFGLELMSSAMKVVTGGVAGSAFDLVNNEIAGLMVGIFATVLVQSSSTSTSIIVGLVGSEVFTVRQAIPVVMGANIGTSITNTFVSLAHLNKEEEFERAFSGACVHDMFNILCVLVLLPLEMATHSLEQLTNMLVNSITGGANAHFEGPIGVIVSPLSDIFLVVDKELLEAPDTIGPNDTLIKGGIFHATKLSDAAAGGIILAFALLVLITALLFLVKLLSSALKGTAGRALAKALNMNGYLAMLMGAGVTVAVQSSSITTATLVPLVGLGVITLEKMYPLTLGANLGTTVTALLASLTQDTTDALQIAFCHLFFNIFGIVLFFPLPILRQIPIRLAQQLGREVRRRRWIAGVYILLAFFVVPGILLGFSSISIVALIAGGLSLTLFLLAFFFYVFLSRHHPHYLPGCLQPKDKKLSVESSSTSGGKSTLSVRLVHDTEGNTNPDAGEQSPDMSSKYVHGDVTRSKFK